MGSVSDGSIDVLGGASCKLKGKMNTNQIRDHLESAIKEHIEKGGKLTIGRFGGSLESFDCPTVCCAIVPYVWKFKNSVKLFRCDQFTFALSVILDIGLNDVWGIVDGFDSPETGDQNQYRKIGAYLREKFKEHIV